MIAESEAPPSDHASRAVHERETDRTRARDDDAAVASGKGPDAGRIGIVVGDSGREGKCRRGQFLRRDGGDQARHAHAGMEIAHLQSGRCCRLLRSRRDGGYG